MKTSIKKILKICLIAFSILVAIIVVLIIIALISLHCKNNRLKKECIEKSILCDTIPYVTEQIEISLKDFDDEEIDSIRFQIIRGGQLANDTLIRSIFTYEDNDYKKMTIPYDRFLKTDTIVAITKSGLYYYISGYRHYTRLNYGMFGPVAVSDCRLYYVVNGNEDVDYLHKFHGLLVR